jgi:acetyl-CoA C-acetyltransferase/acetyl-CoA acyltransferase
MARDAVIALAVRTPIGKRNGALAGWHPADLSGHVLEAIAQRSGVDPALIDDVIWGCVNQAGEQALNIGRSAVLAAGWPESVPATTVDRQCGSSQQAIHFAAAGVISGQYDIAVAGGVESMSRVVMGSARMGADPYGVRVAERFAPGLVSQGVAAELVAARWKLSRAELDELSVRSHDRAGLAQASGAFDREIIAIETPRGTFDRDETIRAGSSTDKLAGLKAVFETPELSARFPEIDWSITAGNSSQIIDGSSALLLMSAQRCSELGLSPRARIHSMSVVGDDPLLMLTGPIPATHKVLASSGLALSDLDHVELNEAFAPVPLAWLAEFDIDPERLNPRGGAIALGHALGSSGTRLMTTMLHALEDNDQQFGLQLMCEAGGMANATIIERL